MENDRNWMISRLCSEHWDLLVIGGGITGAGIALDAASRGLKTALVEMNDFASGTSSKSTKLVHGGLRYLKQLEFALVSEVGRERAIVHQNAPHLVIPEKMMMPPGGGRSRISGSARTGSSASGCLRASVPICAAAAKREVRFHS